MFAFAAHPKREDFLTLAIWLENATPSSVHRDLWDRRHQFASKIRLMAEEPERADYVSAYQALRLFVW